MKNRYTLEDVQEGDTVTMVLDDDGHSRTSTAKSDDDRIFFIGCGAVKNGRGHITSIRRHFPGLYQGFEVNPALAGR